VNETPTDGVQGKCLSCIVSSDETISRKARVVILSAGVGSGHNAAAGAILTGLEQDRDRMDTVVTDALDYANPIFRACYAGGFALGMSRFPRIYGLGYRTTDRPQAPARTIGERIRLRLERLMLRRLTAYLLRGKADLIVCTHFLAAPLIGNLIAQGALETRLFVVVTDDCVHRFWYAENVDRWFVPGRCGCETLLRWEIDPERITVSGIPVQSKWTAPLDREKILRDWKLPEDKRIVLLSGGTDFTCGPIARIAREIVACSPEVHLVVLAGHNKKLLAKVSALPEAGDCIIPIGFTDRLHELMEVCTLLVTKPGGIITAECLAKAVPMVFLRPVPGHEAGNARYFQSEGAGVVTRSVRDVGNAVSRLLTRPEELARMGANARRLYGPGTETICEAIRRAVDVSLQSDAASLARGRA